MRNPIAADDGWTCQWEVPPEAMTQASNLEVAIVLYDLAANGRIAFAWNTPSYKGFIVGSSFADIGLIVGTEEIMPAANEILNINSETRMIVAPSGYNTTVANYGDKGISKVYFAADKYIRGINTLESQIIVNVKFNSEYTNKTILDKAVRPIAEESNKVIICWDITKAITNNADYYTGNFTISVTFIEYESIGEEKIEKKKWTSSSYGGLSIGESLLLTDEHHIAERDEAVFKEIVYEQVDTYLEDNEFTIEDKTY